jgi:hypothetical protein
MVTERPFDDRSAVTIRGCLSVDMSASLRFLVRSSAPRPFLDRLLYLRSFLLARFGERFPGRAMFKSMARSSADLARRARMRHSSA